MSEELIPLRIALKCKTSLVLILSIVCHLISIFGDFVFDDTEAILNNMDVITDTNVSQLFLNDFWGTKMTDNSSHKSYRPLTVFAFRLIRRLDQMIRRKTSQSVDSPLNPILFHFFNIIFYVIFNIVLLKVLTKLFHIFCSNNRYLNERNAFLVTLLFTCHPIHCESVSACVGLADLMSSLMAFIALLLYIESTDRLEDYNYVKFSVCCLLVVLMSGIAMLFKEQGITYIALCIVLDIILLFERPKSGNCGNICVKLLIYRMILLTFGALSLLLIRLKVMDFCGPQFQRGDNPSSFEETLYQRVINYNYIYAINAWVVIYPDWLCFDWSMNCIPLIKSFNDFRIIFILFFWITLCLVIKTSILHSNANIRRQLQISIAFCILPFIPSSNIFFRIGFVVAERALFLPSIGYLMLIITAINLIEKRFQNYFKFIYSLVLFLTIIFTIRSIRRSFDWINERQLFESGVSVCPLNAKVHYNIAKNAADSGLRVKAIEEYREAIRLNPQYEQAFNNLGNILKESGNLDQSKELLMEAIKIRPTFATAWMNLGIVQTALNQHLEAEISYLNAIKHRNRYADCFYNLGNLYVQQKRFDDAYRVWRNAIEINPKLLSAWNNLILMLDNMGSYESAQNIALEALKYHSNQSSLYFNYANILGKIGKFIESEEYFKKAIELNPQKANYYSNLGVLYHRWKDYSKASVNYRIALRIDPNLESAQKNLELLNKSKE